MTVFWICAAVGFVLGRLSAGWAAAMLFDMNHGGLMTCRQCDTAISKYNRWLALPSVRCGGCRRKRRWPLWSAVGLAIAFVVYAFCLLDPVVRAQSLHEVRPDGALVTGRLPFHLSLIFLLWTATVTDFLDYVIPEEVVLLGLVIAIPAAVWSGELQMIHVWVNWDAAEVSLYGPYLPDWMKNHHHWHGLVWSLCGMLTGASVTWLVRFLAGKILGYPALGAGDVTLMAMVGAYMGWQPTLCVLALSPLAGIFLGLGCRLLTGRTYIAFGPYLAFSAYVVLCSWRFLWADGLRLRDIFSHWPTVLGLLGGAILGMCVLLGAVRIFKSLPSEKLKRE